jgi:Domain of unknown function (DUF4383)
MTTRKSNRLNGRRFTFLAVQCAALVVGSALTALGVLGFVPGITTNVDTIGWTGRESGAALFGVFETSMSHNLFHLLMGLVGLVLAKTYARARAYLLGGGAVFLGLWLAGLLTPPDGIASALPVNSSDSWLHFGLGLAMVILALTLAGARVPTGARGEALLPRDPD